MRLLKLSLAGLLLCLASACTTVPLAPVETIEDKVVLAETALTSAANQIKLLKEQGILVRGNAAAADDLLTEGSNALDAAWLAIGKGDEAGALKALRIVQGVNYQLIQYLKMKEKSSGGDEGDGICRGPCGFALGGDGVRRDDHALQHAQGESDGRGPYTVHAGGAGGDPLRTARSGEGSNRRVAWG